MSKGCNFCNNFDFSTVKVNTHSRFPHIESTLCNTRFKEEEQFNFCPECGKMLKNYVETNGVYVVDRDSTGVPVTVNYYHVISSNDDFKIVCVFLGEDFEDYAKLIEYLLNNTNCNDSVELIIVPNKDCYKTSAEAHNALNEELDSLNN